MKRGYIISYLDLPKSPAESEPPAQCGHHKGALNVNLCLHRFPP
jgi:hypothetical protein